MRRLVHALNVAYRTHISPRVHPQQVRPPFWQLVVLAYRGVIGMSSQREKLEQLMAEAVECHMDAFDNAKENQDANLATLCYTASETGLLGDIDSLDPATAVQIWNLVETARMLTPQELATVRM